MRKRSPRIGPKQPAAARRKAISWGLPKFSQAIRGTPLRMEEQGDLCSGRNGADGLRVCLHVRQGRAHQAQVFEPRGGRGLLIAGCKCPAGSRDGVGTPRATQGTGPLESSMGNPPPMSPVPKSVLSTLSVRG